MGAGKDREPQPELRPNLSVCGVRRVNVTPGHEMTTALHPSTLFAT